MKEETVIGVLLRFLQGEEARARTSLISRKESDGMVVLSSYGIPIAELREDKVVIKLAKWHTTLTGVVEYGRLEIQEVPHAEARRQHRKWLEIIAYEKGFSVEYEGY
ncbi:MAG: hypothetical protein A2167_09050 [Planctomycetes bacterium RBG_13_46_10]|nr:MAG: hypothetical protein A2167_09050 [Planctomycetes bacterium RBG_13_46_10]